MLHHFFPGNKYKYKMMNHKTFQAKINDQYKVDLSESETLPFKRTGNNHLHAVQNPHSVRAEIVAENFLEKKYTIRINASLYEITLSNELDLLIEEMGLTAGKGNRQNELRAPMPGLIVEILTKPGTKVKAGEPLLVLEAMKMENTLTAPGEGRIKSINVNISEAVDKGTVLIEFENNEEN